MADEAILNGKLLKERESQRADIWSSTTKHFLGGGWFSLLSSFRIFNKAKYSRSKHAIPSLKLNKKPETLLIYNFNKF